MAARVALQVLCDEENDWALRQALAEFIAEINFEFPVAMQILGRIEGLTPSEKCEDDIELANFVKEELDHIYD